MTDELKPCPFCGGGLTSIRENGKMWTGQRYSEPTSVSVQHHCEPVEGQPSRMIERVGSNRGSAIAAWNRRALSAPAAPEPTCKGDPGECAYNDACMYACGATPAATSVPEGWPSVDEFAQHIRWMNGGNKMGAGALAEKLLEWLQSRAAAPQPGAHGAGVPNVSGNRLAPTQEQR
jgi:hypothetical protein